MDPTRGFYEQEGVLTQLPEEKRTFFLGELLTLLLHAPVHRDYTVNDIGAVFFPPLHANQFRAYRAHGRLVGLITWAFLDEAAEARYMVERCHFRPDQWTSGDRIWIMDFIAPFGHARPIIADMRQNLFPGKRGFALRVRIGKEPKKMHLRAG